ncbi:MAG: hypothetical protein M1825_001505 [Sarcosagium campestre]|nr:MAG: hypothetical protein M1825_001505 [Sarcosagium campestre]
MIVRYGAVAATGGLGIFYWANLETVPVTGRRRFNCISPEYEVKSARMVYDQTLQQFRNAILPARHPSSKMVQRVMKRLIPSSGVDAEWEVHVINDPGQKNAFVLPGGKVFVFSGILPICQNDDGLATVLGHEIAHNVARHQAERQSQMIWLVIAMYGLAAFLGTPDFLNSLLVNLTIAQPGSRKQELEADHIGLLMMAQSCYDPDEAVRLWQRMSKAEKNAPPQFLSTHPSNENRVSKIAGWLPEAQQKRIESECSATLGYTQEFQRAFNGSIWALFLAPTFFDQPLLEKLDVAYHPGGWRCEQDVGHSAQPGQTKWHLADNQAPWMQEDVYVCDALQNHCAPAPSCLEKAAVWKAFKKTPSVKHSTAVHGPLERPAAMLLGDGQM